MADSLTNSRLRLPGRRYDHSARLLREQFLADEIDIEQFLKNNAFHLPRTNEARYLNQIHSYATASLVIEQFWNYLKQCPIDENMEKLRENYGHLPYTERLQAFDRLLCKVINIYRDRFMAEMQTRSKQEDKGAVFTFVLCFVSVARMRHRKLKGRRFPSPNDLISIIARLAEVARPVYERTVGRVASSHEVAALVGHPSLIRFCVGLAINDRAAMHPLTARLMGKSKLKSMSDMFQPEFFEIGQVNDEHILRVKQEVLEDHFKRHEKAAARRMRRHQPPRPSLGCPALYTGEFRNMYEWTVSLIEPWL